MKINTEDVYIVNARCNGAATILMAETGILYACGENNENRLGLADDSWFAWPWTYYGENDDAILVPTKIMALKHRIGNINLNNKNKSAAVRRKNTYMNGDV